MFAKTHKVLANFYEQLGDSTATRRNALQAARYDPWYLRDRRMRSLLFRSMIGRPGVEVQSWSAESSASSDVIVVDFSMDEALEAI